MKLHTWLGLLTGVIVFIVCITGCIYVFKDEINDLTEPWKVIPIEKRNRLLPTQILHKSNKETGNKTPTAITYGEVFNTVQVDYFTPDKGISSVFVNPYNGEIVKILQKGKDEFDFFRFILAGHRNLWLPKSIGKPLIGYSVLVFAITLITGLVMWWPRKWNKKSIRRNFILHIKSPLSRLNWSLHNVLGGYAVLFLLIFCFTGLIWSFEWFSKSVYYISSGGKELKPYILPQSDTLTINKAISDPLDKLHIQLTQQEPDANTFYYSLPSSKEAVIRVSIVHEKSSYYKTDNLFFDQYTLKPLKGSGPYAGKYTEASFPDQLRRMNLEIHDGRILGLPGKILAFIVALTGASLPVTGSIIWYKKKKSFKK